MADVRQAAIVAAKWWAEQISSPNFNSFCNGDRTSDVSFGIMVLGLSLAKQNAPTTEQIEKFETQLAERIDKELEKRVQVNLDCDYGPCLILGEIADSLDISHSLFPYKRYMWVQATSVMVKDGYDAPKKEIYSE